MCGEGLRICLSNTPAPSNCARSAWELKAPSGVKKRRRRLGESLARSTRYPGRPQHVSLSHIREEACHFVVQTKHCSDDIRRSETLSASYAHSC